MKFRGITLIYLFMPVLQNVLKKFTNNYAKSGFDSCDLTLAKAI